MEKRLEEAIKASLIDGYLPCPVAFQVSRKLDIPRREVGDAANELKIRISNCQLGCFVVEKAVYNDVESIHVDQILSAEIESSLVNGRLPCPEAFQIGKRLKVAPKDVRATADELKIKISNCQLGCFP